MGTVSMFLRGSNLSKKSHSSGNNSLDQAVSEDVAAKRHIVKPENVTGLEKWTARLSSSRGTCALSPAQTPRVRVAVSPVEKETLNSKGCKSKRHELSS